MPTSCIGFILCHALAADDECGALAIKPGGFQNLHPRFCRALNLFRHHFACRRGECGLLPFGVAAERRRILSTTKQMIAKSKYTPAIASAAIVPP
jgi:hypothetical protein